MPPKQKDSLGILFKLLNIVCYSTIAVINKVLVVNLNAFQTLFISSIPCLILTVAIIKITRKESLFSLIKGIDKTYFYGTIVNVISLYSVLYSIRSIDITVITSISYLTPIITACLAILILKERITSKIILALLISIVGAITIVKPILTNTAMSHGIITAFISATGWALHDIIVKKQAMRDHWTKQAFLTLILTFLISLPFAITTWQPITYQQTSIFLLLGLLYTLNKMFLVTALSLAPVTLLAPVSFTKIIFASILAYFAFNEVITLNTFIGCVLIMTATTILLYSTKRKISPIKTTNTASINITKTT